MKVEMGRHKIIAVTLSVVIVVLAICFLMLQRGRSAESYRSIRIVELEGTVTIERESIGSLAAAVNMNLMSGDRVSTGEGAYIVLRLDADKYVMLGESGAMEVIAEGSESAGRTSIHLAAGSVLSDIRNPLGEDAAFDIVTPNATMSVRGTVFEVRRTEDDGKGEIAVLVYDGKVAVALAGKESALYEAGEYTEFTDDEAPEFLIEREIITEEQMDEQMLWRLRQIEAEGREIYLGMVQIPEVDLKTPVPELSIVPEAVSTPEAEHIPEAGVTAEPGTVSAVAPRASATPVPAMNTTEPKDSNDWEWKEDTDSEDTVNLEPTQTRGPALNAEPTQEPDLGPDATEEPGLEPQPTEEPDLEPEPTEEPGLEPEPTEEPGLEPQPTEEPGLKPQPTEEPDLKPGPTEEPGLEPQPTEEPGLKPEPTEEPSPEPAPPFSPDEKQKRTVTYCLPYVALSYDRDGTVYSDIREIAVYSYGTLDVTEGEKLEKDWPPNILSTPLGSEPGKADFTCVGWCTEENGEWDFDKDTVQKDVTLYPIWLDGEGRKYYPVIYEAPETDFYICNSVMMGSAGYESSENLGFTEPVREGYVLSGWKNISQEGSLLTRFQAVWEKQGDE